MLKGSEYSEMGESAPRGVGDEVSEGRMYNLNPAIFVWWCHEDGAKTLQYKPSSPSRKAEKGIERHGGELVKHENNGSNDGLDGRNMLQSDRIPEGSPENLEI